MTTQTFPRETWTRLFPGVPAPLTDAEIIRRMGLEIEALRYLTATPRGEGMRSPDHIQRAHDLLGSVALSVLMRPAVPLEDRERLYRHLDALCWVLGHDHNTALSEMLDRIEKWMAENEIDFKRIPGVLPEGKV
jgi:hypothetical protein